MSSAGRDRAALFRTALEQSSLPMAATEGKTHLVRYANPAFCRFVGREEGEVVGQRLPTVLGDTEMGDTVALLEHVYRAGGAASVAVFRGGGAGAAMYVTYAAWVVPAEGDRPAGLLVQAMDTSDQTLAGRQAAEAAEELRDVNRHLLQAGLEAELRAETHLTLNAALLETEKRLNLALAEREQLLASEHAARSQAEAALRVRDEFLAMVAHELRTPLTSIKGSAQVALRTLQRGTLDAAPLLRQLGNVVASSSRLEALLTDLLDVSQMRAGGLSVQLTPMDLAALAGAVTRRYQENAGPVQILSHLPSRTTRVRGDAGRLEQVLENLLNNAVKYSPAGGTVVVRLRRVSDGVLLTVQDGGIGIPSGEEEHIFEPFRRAPNALANGLKGIGLGLHISRQIAQIHGGTLRAESQGEGSGTTLLLWLPRLTPAARLDARPS